MVVIQTNIYIFNRVCLFRNDTTLVKRKLKSEIIHNKCENLRSFMKYVTLFF